jgi:hypothetical protein
MDINESRIFEFMIIHIYFKVTHVRAERDILAKAKYEWIVDLKCSF